MENSLTSALIHGDDDDEQVGVESAKGGWRPSLYLIGAEVAERFAMYGSTGNLITYVTDVLHEPMATAAKELNFWAGVSALTPLLGGFLADVYLGGYTTIFLSSFFYILGLVMLTITVAVVPSEFQHFPFFISLYLLSIAQGGNEPCGITFGADQFDESNPEEREAKSAFFNWWYFATCSGGSAGMLIAIYVQDNVGWVWGFAIPTVVMVAGFVVFLCGRRSYRQHGPSGSPVIGVMQVFVAACCKGNVCVPKDEYNHVECCEDRDTDEVQGVKIMNRPLLRTSQFKYLDKATIMDDIDGLSETKNNWRLCSVTQVEEVKLLLRLVPIWFSSLTFTLVFSQVGTFFTKQGQTMDTSITDKFHVSPASLQVFGMLGVVLIVPIYDRLFIPIARPFTGLPSGITILQRVGLGMFFSTIEMVVAALVETRRVNIATEYGLLDLPNTIVPMSIWWLLPQYILWGVSNAFTIIGLRELFYDQTPERMRSMGSATLLSTFAVGNFMSSLIISAVQYVSSNAGDMWLVDNLNRAHLDYYYWLLAGISCLGFSVFTVVAKFFVYKKVYGGASP